MTKKISLLRSGVTYDPIRVSYSISLSVVQYEGITNYIFVKQRFRKTKSLDFEDVFVAVASPAQLDDFDVNSPAEGDSHFRTKEITLTTKTLVYLEQVFQQIVVDIQKLVDEFEVKEILDPQGIYEIFSDHVEINTMLLHTHYRPALIAQPCGINETYVEDDISYQRVASQDADLTGWLNTTGGDPAGYDFKYNIAEDPSLASIYPPDQEMLDNYAKLEVNGVVKASTEVKFTQDTIYWKGNLAGQCPWPIDWVSAMAPGAEQTQVAIVLDLIK